jgi:hypothetical protein
MSRSRMRSGRSLQAAPALVSITTLGMDVRPLGLTQAGDTENRRLIRGFTASA